MEIDLASTLAAHNFQAMSMAVTKKMVTHNFQATSSDVICPRAIDLTPAEGV